MQLSLIHTEQETFLDVVSLDGPRDSIGGIKSTDEDGQVKSSHNECSHSAFAMGMVACRRIPGEMSIHSSSFPILFPSQLVPTTSPDRNTGPLLLKFLTSPNTVAASGLPTAFLTESAFSKLRMA